MAHSPPRKKIMFHVQHLLGIGHLERARRLTRYLEEAGMNVTIVSGGMPHPDADAQNSKVIQLSPARAADAAFSQLLDFNGNPISDDWRAQRSTSLLKAFEDNAPDALIIEMFPFSRRQFSFELLPLLQAARHRRPAPLVLCSVRDVLIPSAKAGRAAESLARAQEYFDYILVHGDAGFLRLDESFPLAAALGDKIIYTGYVTARAPAALVNDLGNNEVIISAGGGAVGEALLTTALKARAFSRMAGNRLWRVLVGANAPEGQLQALRKIAPEGVWVEQARPEFPQMLLNCVCSISQGGYNTVMDILQAKAAAQTPAVIVPFATEREQEQTVRATALAKAGLAVVLPEARLNPASLAAAVDEAISHKSRPCQMPDLNGGVTTAHIIKEKLNV